MTNNNKKANFLITVLYPDNTDFATDVNSELTIQSEIAKTMHTLAEKGLINHFSIGDDDVISKKISK